MAVSVSVVYLRGHVTDWEQRSLRGLELRKGAKFKVWSLLNAYHFHTMIKSKNYKSDHCKSGLYILSLSTSDYFKSLPNIFI